MASGEAASSVPRKVHTILLSIWMYQKNGTDFLIGTDEAAKLWREIQTSVLILLIKLQFPSSLTKELRIILNFRALYLHLHIYIDEQITLSLNFRALSNDTI